MTTTFGRMGLQFDLRDKERGVGFPTGVRMLIVDATCRAGGQPRVGF